MPITTTDSPVRAGAQGGEPAGGESGTGLFGGTPPPRRYTLEVGAKRKLVVPAVLTERHVAMLDALVRRVAPADCAGQSRSAVFRRLIEQEHENPRIAAGTVQPRNRWDEPQKHEGGTRP